MKFRELWDRLLGRAQQAGSAEEPGGGENSLVSSFGETFVSDVFQPVDAPNSFLAFGAMPDLPPPEHALPTCVDRKKWVTLTASAVEYTQQSLKLGGFSYLWLEVKQQGQAYWYHVVPDGRLDREGDYLDDSQGVPVLVDRKSAAFLAGATLDWRFTLQGHFAYMIDGPEARLAAEPADPHGVDSSPGGPGSDPPGQARRHHPVVDIASVIGDERLHRPEAATMSDAEFWGICRDHAHPVIGSIEELSARERIRELVSQRYDLGEAVPVDVFLWRPGPPPQPYLTKAGGVPHRERTRPWPTAHDGTPLTFVAQICFLDSKDILFGHPDADVMLVFLRENGLPAPGDLRIEWSSIELKHPMSPSADLPHGFKVPELTGEVFRRLEYPESVELVRRKGFDEWFFPTMPAQISKIGHAAFWIQEDSRLHDEDLLCVLDSFDVTFGDNGCIYFFGGDEWRCDCY